MNQLSSMKEHGTDVRTTTLSLPEARAYLAQRMASSGDTILDKLDRGCLRALARLLQSPQHQTSKQSSTLAFVPCRNQEPLLMLSVCVCSMLASFRNFPIQCIPTCSFACVLQKARLPQIGFPRLGETSPEKAQHDTFAEPMPKPKALVLSHLDKQ